MFHDCPVSRVEDYTLHYMMADFADTVSLNKRGDSYNYLKTISVMWAEDGHIDFTEFEFKMLTPKQCIKLEFYMLDKYGTHVECLGTRNLEELE